jgi:hypothetical protein
MTTKNLVNIYIITTFLFIPAQASAQNQPNDIVLQPGAPVGSSIAPGTLAFTIKKKDGLFQMLSNFHIFNRKGLQSSIKRPFIRFINLFSDDEHTIFYNGTKIIGYGARYFDLWEKGCVLDNKICRFDAAFANFDDIYRTSWTNQIKNCDKMVITSLSNAKVGDFVAKFGKTTQLTIGIVKQIEQTGNNKLKSEIRIENLKEADVKKFNSLYSNTDLHIRHNLSLNAPSETGDSGSAWFLWPSEQDIISKSDFIELKVVGLHHSGATGYSIATRIDFILRALNATIPSIIDMPTNVKSSVYANSSYDKWFSEKGYNMMCLLK